MLSPFINSAQVDRLLDEIEFPTDLRSISLLADIYRSSRKRFADMIARGSTGSPRFATP